jgi:GT2 family glycosyltransferase
MECHKSCGIVSPQFLDLDGSIQPSCRRFPRHRDLLFLALGFDKLFSKSKIFNYWKMGDFDFRSQQKVDQPQGAFLLTHRTALEQVGLLDEQFPMFFSDVDWCRRFIAKGWEIFFSPETQIIHDKGTSIYRNRLRMIWSSHRSFYDYFVKYYPGKGWKIVNGLTAGLLLFMALLRSIFLVLTINSWEIK